jgi:hypothetical protein
MAAVSRTRVDSVRAYAETRRVVVLLAVGTALVVFGSLVLLRFPDRPGGRLAWRGMEVGSAGAGLPLIALGVAVSEPAPPGCFADYLVDIRTPTKRAPSPGPSR